MVYWTLGTDFFYCEFGERMSEPFEKIDDAIDQLDWYTFPNEIKRMLPIIIMNVHETVDISAFGSISCSRETFKKVSPWH